MYSTDLSYAIQDALALYPLSLAFSTLICVLMASSIAWLILTYRKSDGVSGPFALPILGNSLSLERNAFAFYKQLFGYCEQFGYVFRLILGFRTVVLCGTVETFEAILNNSRNITKSREYNFLFPWLKTGLLTSTGSKWKDRRRLLTPSFHFSILQDFYKIMNNQSKTLIERFRKEARSDKLIEIESFVSCCSLDIMCEAAMGTSCNAQNDSESPYVVAVHSLLQLIQDRALRPWLWYDPIYNLLPAGRTHARGLKIVHSFTSKVINNRIAELKGNCRPSSSRYLNFLDALLESYQGGSIDVAGLNEEVDTFMFEGHDTTASGISFCLYVLGRNSDYQEQLFNDIREHIVDDDDIGKYIAESKLLDRIIKESLRLYPPVPVMLRQLDEDLTVGSYHVKRGCSVGLAVMALHRNPAIWENEKEFNPNRFLPENSIKRSPYAYVPFSAGSRNCIGQKFALMELKLVITQVVRHFQFESDQTEEELECCGEIILRSKQGIRLRMKERIC